jgi:hypothetical protein
MSSIVTRRYRSKDVENLGGGYRKQSIMIARIPNHKNGHYVRPNRVVFKYLDFKKNVNRNVHVRVFNSVMKVDVKTSEKYIINVFNYTLRDTTSD